MRICRKGRRFGDVSQNSALLSEADSRPLFCDESNGKREGEREDFRCVGLLLIIPKIFPMNIHIPDDSPKQINYIRSYSKQILLLLSGIMNSNSHLKDLYQLITELHTLTHRETLNQPLYFFSRRQKAQVAKFLTELYYEQELLSEDTYKDIKKNLNLIFFENFSQQILPATTGIIPSTNQKKEMYLNTSKVLGRDILEPREYLGIVPEATSDLDAPSLVTAETPPNYEQPWHDH